MPVGEKAAWIGAGALVVAALIGILANTNNQPSIIIGGSSSAVSQSLTIGNGVATSQSIASGGNNSSTISTNKPSK